MRVWICYNYTMVNGSASGLSPVHVDSHAITVLCHLHQCKPCILVLGGIHLVKCIVLGRGVSID